MDVQTRRDISKTVEDRAGFTGLPPREGEGKGVSGGRGWASSTFSADLRLCIEVT